MSSKVKCIIHNNGSYDPKRKLQMTGEQPVNDKKCLYAADMIKSSHRLLTDGWKFYTSLNHPSNFIIVRFFAKRKSKYAEYDEDLLSYLHGRKSTEREDSVTKQILSERKIHQSRFQEVQVDSSLVLKMNKIGLGSKKRINLSSSRHISAHSSSSSSSHKSIGAGGFAVHLTSAANDWPVFTHVLPEIAFAGHTNSGKVSPL